MTLKSQKKDVEEKLRPFLENSINLPEKILTQMDIFFESIQAVLADAKLIYHVANEHSFNVITFSTLIENLEKLKKKYEHMHQLTEESTNFFQVLIQLMQNPLKKVNKYPYLAKLKHSSWFGNQYVTEDAFVSKSFYKLSYAPLDQFITNLGPLKPFLQTKHPKNSDHHHPFTLKILSYIQEIPETVEDCLSEILPGVMYFELPPSIVLLNSQSQEFSVINEIVRFAKPNNIMYSYLKTVIKEYSAILEEYRRREEEIKMVGFWKDKKGLEEFEKLVNRLKKYQRKLEKVGFFPDD